MLHVSESITVESLSVHGKLKCTVKNPKISHTRKNCCNYPKSCTLWFYHGIMRPKDADGMANSVDPDSTAPIWAVWSGSTMFAQAYMYKNLGPLRYISISLQRLYLRQPLRAVKNQREATSMKFSNFVILRHAMKMLYNETSNSLPGRPNN